MRADYESDLREVEQEHMRQQRLDAASPRLVALRERVREVITDGRRRHYETAVDLETFLNVIEERIVYGVDLTAEGEQSFTERLDRIVGASK